MKTTIKWCEKCKKWISVYPMQNYCSQCDGRLRER